MTPNDKRGLQSALRAPTPHTNTGAQFRWAIGAGAQDEHIDLMRNSLQTTNGFGSCVWRPKGGKLAIHPNLVRRSFCFAIELFWESAQTGFGSPFATIAWNWILIRDEGRTKRILNSFSLTNLIAEWQRAWSCIQLKRHDFVKLIHYRDQLVLQSLNYLQMIQFNGITATFGPEQVTRNEIFPLIVSILPLRAII